MYKSIYRFSSDYCAWLQEYATNDFSADPLEQKRVLGGKGAALVDMCAMGLPVPPGWTITTEMCNDWRQMGQASAKERADFMAPLLVQSATHHMDLAEEFGFAPLVSVRSGAPVSMPGMMDTILNVGLTTENLDEWADRIGERAALDSYRRLIQMLGSTAFGVDHAQFEAELDAWKKKAGVLEDKALEPKYLKEVVAGYLDIFELATGHPFPDTFDKQLDCAIRSVFDSWLNPRAIEYRKMQNISEAMGTAVTVQAMVFGNMGETSGSGVLFTRNPSTGENVVMAEYLANAQGEDVVAGTRTPAKLIVGGDAPEAHEHKWLDDLAVVCTRLEEVYEDMVDVEFTVQEGKLFILQSRTGKRSARAAFKIAYDLVQAQVIDKDTALSRLTRAQYKIARMPGIDPSFNMEPHLVGLPACPGVVFGKAVFSSADAVNCTEPCILVTHETTPDDIAGMNKAAGILTQTGGATSHAAVVARAMDTPCVVGCTDLELQTSNGSSLMGKNGVQFINTDKVTIDGGTGRVWVGVDVPLVDVSDSEEIQAVEEWCLDRGGYSRESILVPEDANASYVIRVHEWWGDTEVLDIVMEELSEMQSVEHITLDLRSPKDLTPSDDYALLEAFQSDAHKKDGFEKSALAFLLSSSPIKGLTVLLGETSGADIPSLRKAGYVVPKDPETVADVMGSVIMPPSDKFIEYIVGGKQAWEVLMDALKAGGYEMKMQGMAVPREYAVFSQLEASA